MFDLKGRIGLDANDLESGAQKGKKALQEVRDEAEKLDGTSVDVKADVDDKATPELKAVRADAKDLDGETVEIEVDAEVDAGALEDDGAEAGSSLSAGMKGAIAGAAIGAFLGKTVADGFDRMNVTARFEQRFGLTNKRLGELGGEAGKIYADGWAESREDVLMSLGAIEQRLVRTGEITKGETDEIARQALGIAEVFDVDVQEVIRSTGQLMLNDMAPDAETALDLVVTALQNGANAADDVFESIDEYAQHFDAFGLGAEDMMAIFVRGMENGQRDTDKLADAVKEMRIRTVETGDEISDAYDSLGLSADDYRAKIIAGGEGARIAFGEIIGALRSVEDPIEQNRLAIALIGTQYEDLGPTALDALSAIDEGMGETAGAVDGLVDSLEDSRSEMEKIKRRVTGVIGALGEETAGYINEMVDEFGSGMDRLNLMQLAEEHAEVAQEIYTHGDGILELTKRGDDLVDTSGRLSDALKRQEDAARLARIESGELSDQSDRVSDALAREERAAFEASGMADQLAGSSLRAADAQHRLDNDVGLLDQSLRNLISTQREMVSPAFAAMRSQERLDDAIASLNAEGGNTPENLRAVVEAQMELDAANATLATSTDTSAEAIMRMGLEAGLTEQQAWDLAAGVAGAKDKADAFVGEYKADIVADASQANATIDGILNRPRTVWVDIGVRGGTSLGISANDAGGRLGANDVGLVAERRPEVVNGALIMTPTVIAGPADITGGAATAAMLAANGGSAPMMPMPASSAEMVSPAFDVTVFVGDREITEIVDVRVEQKERATVSRMRAGARR